MCLLQIYWKIPGFLKQMKIFKKKNNKIFIPVSWMTELKNRI